MASEKVRIDSGGVGLTGLLHLPDHEPGALAGVVLTGPFTGVKEQVVNLYAQRLAAAGFAALAFDHRGFGESEGRAQHEDAAGKLADLRAAVGFLADHPAVDPDRVGLLGVCLGGGYAVRAAAFDPRVRAVAGVAGAYNSPRAFMTSMGAEAYRNALAGFLAAGPDAGCRRSLPMADRPRWAGRSRGTTTAPSARAARTGATRSRSLAVRADEPGHAVVRRPARADAAAGRARHPRRLLQPGGCAGGVRPRLRAQDAALAGDLNHIDLYDVPNYLDPAVSALVDFYGRELAPR
jgi:dienelactone hydrolase